MLKDIFITLCLNYTSQKAKIEELWQEIEQHYNGKVRYYHNLSHLGNMFTEVERCRHLVLEWDTLLFSLFYHDIIYSPTSKNNEEKSAELAVTRLKEIGCNAAITEKCRLQILATKNHEQSIDNDTNLFTDADLSILGSPRINYFEYSRQIRDEYKIYPDIIYNAGRRKVIKHFLEMDAIYKTQFFRDKYEKQARNNLMEEEGLLCKK